MIVIYIDWPPYTWIAHSFNKDIQIFMRRFWHKTDYTWQQLSLRTFGKSETKLKYCCYSWEALSWVFKLIPLVISTLMLYVSGTYSSVFFNVTFNDQCLFNTRNTEIHFKTGVRAVFSIVGKLYRLQRCSIRFAAIVRMDTVSNITH